MAFSLAVTVSIVFNSYFIIVLSTRVVVAFTLSVTVGLINFSGIISTRVVMAFTLAMTVSIILISALKVNITVSAILLKT
jgi:hypothetical protein